MAAKKSQKDTKDQVLFLRVTQAQKERLQKDAAERGLSLSSWLLFAALQKGSNA